MIQRFDELRRLGKLLTKPEHRLVDGLMAEHFRLGGRLETIVVPNRPGGLDILDKDTYDAAVAEFESYRAALEAEIARRLRRWL